MEFDNSFEVPLTPARAWPLLMDIRRIAPCMPGAELTEVVDDKTYKGKIAVRLGPVALSGAVAQYGRGVGIVQATAAQIMNQFAANLRQQIASESPAGAPASAVKPISGLALMAKVIWDAITRLFRGA